MVKYWNSKVKKLEKRLKEIHRSEFTKIFFVKNEEEADQIKSTLPDYVEKAIFIIDLWSSEEKEEV